MKTKLNFLLPMFLGMVMVLALSIALEACGDSPSKPPKDGDSSSDGYIPFSSANEFSVDSTVAITGFEIIDDGFEFQIKGLINSKVNLTSIKFIRNPNKFDVEFSGQISGQGNVTFTNSKEWPENTGPIGDIPLTGSVTINRAYLECGDFGIRVEACAGAGNCAYGNGSSVKPLGECMSSSSEPSSSSEAGWVFGEWGLIQVPALNGSGDIGTGSFVLQDDDDEMLAVFTGAQIQDAGIQIHTLTGNALTGNGAGAATVDQEIPNSKFKSMSSPKNEMALQKNNAYIVTAGNDKYLFWLTTAAATASPSAWPARIHYQRAKEYPTD